MLNVEYKWNNSSSKEKNNHYLKKLKWEIICLQDINVRKKNIKYLFYKNFSKNNNTKKWNCFVYKSPTKTRTCTD